MGGLVRTALRLTAYKALVGKTFAGPNVQDSSIVPLTTAITEAPAPVIVIYTDEDDHPIDGLDLLTAPANGCAMVFLVAVAGAATVDNGAIEITFPATDAASELKLDILETDIKTALLDPRDKWAELWRRFAMRAVRWRSQRGSNEEKGARFAARQLIIDLDPIADPIAGAEPEGLWADLVATIAADSDTDFAGLADLLTRAIRGRAVLSEREREQMRMGLTAAGMWVSGLPPAPIDYTETAGEDLAPLTEVEIDAALGTNVEFEIVSTEDEGEAG